MPNLLLPQVVTTAPQKTASPAANMNIELRTIVNDAYAFVRGNDFNKYASCLTYEELLSLAIDRIDGTQTNSAVRTTRLARIAQIKSSIATAVQTITSKPPSAWVIQGEDIDSEEVANTPEEETPPA